MRQADQTAQVWWALDIMRKMWRLWAPVNKAQARIALMEAAYWRSVQTDGVCNDEAIAIYEKMRGLVGQWVELEVKEYGVSFARGYIITRADEVPEYADERMQSWPWYEARRRDGSNMSVVGLLRCDVVRLLGYKDICKDC